MVSRFFRQAGDSDSETESSDEESLMSGDEAQKPAAPAKPKSRFLRSGGSSDSESSSEEEEEETDSSEEEKKAAPTAQKVSKYLATGSDDEDSDEEVKRVVKSAKDKRLEDMEATGNTMKNALKINDWTAISAGRSSPIPEDVTEE
jgi:translation initiation factor 3 subunit C